VNVAGTGDAPTIQAAIDSASAGDTVLLAPGTYLWSSQAASPHSMVILKPGLTLRGEAGAGGTILDAERNGRVMLLYDVGELVRIEGLTIQTGEGRSALGPPLLDSFGGGMYIAGGSNPTIANCIIRDNYVNTTQVGAGIYCESARIENCQVLENFGNLDARGIGIWSDSTLVVRGTTFRGNWVNGDSGSYGAGLAARNATIADCWIEGNQTSGVFGAGAGGISIGDGVVERCVFVGNEAFGGFGGARAAALGAGSGVEIRDCIFVANRVVGNPAVGAALFLRGGATATRCTIVGNIAEGGGTPIAGVYFDERTNEPTSVTSSLVAWNNGAVCNDGGIWSCNNIFGNTLGNAICGTDAGGNFSADPEFCAADPVASMNFTLQADSPCAPGQHPDGNACGQVGAAPVGCGAVSVQQATWSHVKGLYRE